VTLLRGIVVGLPTLLLIASAGVASAQVMHVPPSSDTYVDSSEPLRNFDSHTRLNIDKSPQRIAYLRFHVTGVGSRRVAGARLRLEATSGSESSAGQVHLVSDLGWDAATLSFTNRPALGGVLDSQGPVAGNTIVSFDLGTAITGDGVYAFGLSSSSSDGVAYRSSASTKGLRPELEITLAAEGEPSVTIVQPVDRSIVRAEQPVTLQAIAASASGADLSARTVWASNLAGLLGAGASVVLPRLSVGVHTISAQVSDPGNGATGTASVRLTVIPADGNLTFPAIADTFVDASQPTVAFGSSTSFRVDSSPVNRAYLRFQVSGITAPVKQARLRLTAGGSDGAASDSGGAVFRVSDHSWSEATTFATAPPTDGSALATQGAVNPNAVVEFDVTRAVVSDGLVDLAVVGRSSDSAAYRSREAGTVAGRPQLIVSLQVPDEEPTVALQSPATGTEVIYGQPLAFQASASDPQDGDLGAQIMWTSSIEGSIGSGRSFTRVLTPGTHTITATAADRDGNGATASVHVTVRVSETGVEGFAYGEGVETSTNRATAEKPESKLWYHDGQWWATLYSPTGRGHRIHRLDPATRSWIDTGVLVDERPRSRQDVLSEGSRLYIASRFAGTSAQNRLVRYSYLPSTRTYALDAGFPVAIAGGGAETITLAKDSRGTLWIAYVLGQRVFESHTLGSDTQWSTPAVLPVAEGTTVSADDIAAVVALPGAIGVFWNSHVTSSFYFAVHADGLPATDPAAWRLEIATRSSNVADDHVNLKVAPDGRLFAVVKTDRTGPDATTIGLLVRSPSGVWSPLHKVASLAVEPSRPQCLIDVSRNRIFVVYSAHSNGIFYKSSGLNTISFPEGIGIPLITTAAASSLNNPTATKQNVTAATGIVILGSAPATRRYWHNTIP
jgi:hypothetical protein